MNTLSKLLKLYVLLISVFILITGASAYTASNTIANSHVDQYDVAIIPNDLKPTACMGISIVNLISIGDGEVATNRSDLIVGTPNQDIISGLSRDDCILGGDGDDEIYGGAGSDIIMGGAGNDILYGEGGGDILDGGSGYDICIGGGGKDQSINCEETR